MFEDVKEISEKYDDFEKMAEGGMGTLYRARHKSLDELRVIKTIKRDIRKPDAPQRFAREARIAAKLRHPNIATLYDFVAPDDGTAFIVMEYIEGMNLYEYYQDGFRLSHGQIGVLASQILDALDYLHSQKFIHRDLSLDNLMVTRGPRGESIYKLIDPGLAKSLDTVEPQTQTGIALGKVSYISPEELTYGSGASEIDHRADLYSFAVVLYHLLTRELPITGTDQASLIAGHLYREPKDFELTDPSGQIPTGLRSVLLKALSKEPDDRYPDAHTLRAALAQHLPLDSRSAPVEEVLGQTTQLPTQKPERKKRRGAPSLDFRLVAAIATVTLLVGLLWFALSRGVDARSTAATPPSSDAPPRGAATTNFGRYHALIIGNNDYEKLPRLETAVRDAEEIARILERKYSFEVDLLVNATRKTILDKLYELQENLTTRDNLLLYYAGHGHLENRVEYWQPIDADLSSTTQWIPTAAEVTGYVNRMEARHVLVVADSCYAGAEGALPDTADTEMAELVRRHSRLILTSGNTQPVADQGGEGHSVFARVFIDLLRQNDDITSVLDLFREIETKVPELARRNGREQQPTFSPLEGTADAGGMFFLVPGRGAKASRTYEPPFLPSRPVEVASW